MAGEICAISPEAAGEFLKCCSFVASRAGPKGLERWCREGLGVLRSSEVSGVAYYRLETARSSTLLDRLSPGVTLESVRALLQTYCLALTGAAASILPLPRAAGDGGGLSNDAEAGGLPVFLPEFAGKYPEKPENFAWLKVMTTHQMAHTEFGSRDFASGRTRELLPDLEDGAEPGLGDFIREFPDRRLAGDIFRTVEDARVDSLVTQRYRGIASTLRRVQAEALAERPAIELLPPREAFVEHLVRLSLGQADGCATSGHLRAAMDAAVPIMHSLRLPAVTVADSAEATVRLYAIASDVLNVDSSGCSVPYTGPAEVEYRDAFPLDIEEPSDTAKTGQEEADTSPSQGSSQVSGGDEEMDVGSLAVDQESPEESVAAALSQTDQEDLLKAARHRPHGGDDNSEGALELDGPNSYLYDEWDFRADDYRLRWCRVRETTLEEGTPEFFEATLEQNAGLVRQIKRRFEVLNPEYRRKVKGLTDGEDYDLDAVVDFIIGRKVGQSQDNRVYVRRDKTERDVSVALLLDMSSSTIEYIGRTQRDGSGRPVFRDYKDYFEWLQTYDESKVRPQAFKRIIDLEKESIVLLIKALEAVGDSYGIYGFSGHGRENVEFYVMKDLGEALSDRTRSRIDAIAPRYGTRMGPAIRHTIRKLEQEPARSKYLFLISDGRPEDYGYGRHGLEKEYAVHDTRMALLEAKWQGITTFCLTLDRAGHDYLKAMCADMRYEVMADIERLPECLPALYGRITT